MSDPRIEDLATRFVAARKSGQKIEEAGLPWLPATFDEAFAVQDAVMAKLGGKIGGYKVYKIDGQPGQFAAVRDIDILTSPASIRSPSARLGFECEIAFRIGKKLDAPADGKAFTRAEVAEATECALVNIEVVETRLTDYCKPPSLAGLADSFNACQFVLGTVIKDWQKYDLDGTAAEVMFDGQTVVAKAGGHPCPHPFDPMPWLATELWRRGRPLEAGQVVTTGSYTGNSHATPGTKIDIRFPGIGEASATFVGA